MALVQLPCKGESRRGARESRGEAPGGQRWCRCRAREMAEAWAWALRGCARARCRAHRVAARLLLGGQARAAERTRVSVAGDRAGRPVWQ